jgi:dsDNA-specific endonuclease/ATPase MutS2
MYSRLAWLPLLLFEALFCNHLSSCYERCSYYVDHQALRAEADGKALVLLDELGTGTDPTEGAALGVALLRKMVSGGQGGGALIVATTHHSIMTGLKFEDQR